MYRYHGCKAVELHIFQQARTMGNYWFRPKQFWYWFAAYYPSSWQGWAVSICLGAILVLDIGWVVNVFGVNCLSLLLVLPVTIVLAIVFDIFCRVRGEFPSWWRKK